MIRFARRLALLAALAAGLVAVTTTGTASAASCGVALIDDWYDGHIDKTYPLHCYKDALKIVGQRSDIDIYSNARQDILLALQAAIAAGRGGGGGGPDGYLGSTETADALPSFLGGPNAGNGGRGTGDSPITVTKVHAGNGSNPIGDTLQSGSASSVPLPAIVLGSIALLLLALGLAAYLARRRRQTFRPQTEGPPES